MLLKRPNKPPNSSCFNIDLSNLSQFNKAFFQLNPQPGHCKIWVIVKYRLEGILVFRLL